MLENLSQPWSFMQMVPHELSIFISNNPTYMGLNHIRLTRMSIIFSHNILVLEGGSDVVETHTNWSS